MHALEHRGAEQPADEWAYDLEGEMTPELEEQLQNLTLRAFDALECVDFARADFRVDARGRPWFLEINPLPTFAPDGTFAIAAELMNQSYDAFLADVFRRALRRRQLGD